MKEFNWYRDVGCSQEDHLPNCGHFGYTGGYLSAHLETCPQHKGKNQPCNCNPKAREKALLDSTKKYMHKPGG